MSEEYRQGFIDGFLAAGGLPPEASFQARGRSMRYESDLAIAKKGLPQRKRKVKQSPKQKLLTKMTKVKWNKYKKGSGKKTYVEIRGEVSRSQKYKKAARRL